MTTIFGRQPVVWIGLLMTLLMGIVAALSAQPVVVDGQPLQTAANVIKIVGPLIAAFIAQNFVTPTSSPVLPVGTAVTTPEGLATTTVASVPAQVSIPTTPKV